MAGMTRWRCRRGVLELDQLLFRFYDTLYSSLSSEQAQVFDALLELQDPVLLSWLVYGQPCDDPYFAPMIQQILEAK